MRIVAVHRLRHAFRLFCVAGTASERGIAMPLGGHRLSFADQVTLRTLPLERNTTGIDHETDPSLPARVSAMRRTSPIETAIWHDGDLDGADAWRTAAINLLGALGDDADAGDLRHAEMAGLGPGRAAPEDPLYSADAPLRRHVVWGRTTNPVDTLRALSQIDPVVATAIEDMRP